MNANSAVPLDDQKEKPNFLVEVNNIEKQLWALIHSKGLLHPDVKDLYWKAGSIYEKIFMSNLKHEELQEVEYYLWKLHYKHIDEFRKAIKTAYSVNSEGKRRSLTTQNGSGLLEEFESFLARATEFYKNLIVKIKEHYGVSEEFSTQEREILSASLESEAVTKCKFLGHRFCVCLGDLARYREQYMKVGDDCPNWSAAATHYLEAAKIWPDSGNPHNQLAVLATYVDDEFLALYHCVRSIAIKEPFPDAWNNLLLLFEKNRLSRLQLLSFDTRFNFSKPSERLSAEKSLLMDNNLSSCSTASNVEKEFMAGMNLWRLVVRTVSFFFLKSSLDDFPCVLASTIRELDIAMAADDRNLKIMLQSYQLMDSVAKGPFRILQLVSILIFIFHNLTTNQEKSSPDCITEQVTLTCLVLAVSFIIMGRLVERCLKINSLDSFTLLPGILVFVEYLPFMLDKAEECRLDDKSSAAMDYFFGAFVDLSNQLNLMNKRSSPETIALWEDHELRAFSPVAPAHKLLDFSSRQDPRNNFERCNEIRLQRILNSAIKIANQQKGDQKWILCDKQGTQFSRASSASSDRKAPGRMGCQEKILDEDRDQVAGAAEEGKQRTGENNGKCDTAGTEVINGENDKCVAAEEEEVILLKPLTRVNSAPPLCPAVNTKNRLEGSHQTMANQRVSSDDSLRRATSLLVDHIPQETNSSIFSFTEGFKDMESPHPFLEGTISGRPPSLSAWVVNSDKEKQRSSISKHSGLSPIDETAAVASFSCVSIINGECSSTSTNASSYSPPTPSAPLIPEDASWFHGDTTTTTNKADSFHGQIGSGDSTLLNYGLPLPGFIKRYPKPPFIGISSSEWLRRYRESQVLESGNHNQAQTTNNLRSFLAHETSKFSLLDRYGTPGDHHPRIHSENSFFYPGIDSQFYLGENNSKREKILQGYPRTNAFGFGVTPADLRENPKPLPQYLKEKEWLI